MKRLNYYATLIAAATLLAGCSDDNLPGSGNAGKERPKVTVTRGDVTPTNVQFSISASENAAQYGYVVLAGEQTTAPEALDILTNTVKNTVAHGVYNYSDAASKPASFNYKADVAYTIFAAAITESGLMSLVETTEINIDDTVAPTANMFEVLSANSLSVTFSEKVFFAESQTLQATVRYYKPMTSKIMDEIVTTEPAIIPRGNIVIDGALVVFTVPHQPGGTFLIEYPAGFFQDAAGNRCSEKRVEYNETKKDFDGLRGKSPAIPFSILPEYFVTPGANTNWNAEGASISLTIPRTIYDAGIKNSIRMTYQESDGFSIVNALYSLSVADGTSTVEVFLPKPPTGKFDVEISEGAFLDEYGNKTSVFRMEQDKYRFEQKFYIHTGIYDVNYQPLTEFTTETVLSETSGQSFILRIDPFDPDNGLYKIQTTWFNIYAHPYVPATKPTTVIDPVLLGKADFQAKTITFDGKYLQTTGDVYDKIVTHPDGTPDIAIPAFFYFDNLTKPKDGLIFYGGGDDGSSPIVITFDDDGKLLTLSKCGFGFHNIEEDKRTAWFDAIWDTATLDLRP